MLKGCRQGSGQFSGSTTQTCQLGNWGQTVLSSMASLAFADASKLPSMSSSAMRGPQSSHEPPLQIFLIQLATWPLPFSTVCPSRLLCYSMEPLWESHLTILCFKSFKKLPLPKVHIIWTHLSSDTTSSTELSGGTRSISTPFHSPEEKFFFPFAP